VIRLVIADDQALVRAGLRGLLELAGDFEVVAEAGDGEAAIECTVQAAPDLLLLDVRMPRRSGIEVLHALRERGALPPTLLLTTFDDDEALLQGMRAGARGFLLKDVTPERLYEAMRRVARGESVFQPALTERMLQQAGSAAGSGDGFAPETLTPRETEVLRLMAGGFSNKEIARAVGTAEGTIKNHVSNVLAKLGVRDRTRAVLKAMQEGLL
jgi:DNA-binding NarL/FixJ family response regulator